MIARVRDLSGVGDLATDVDIAECVEFARAHTGKLRGNDYYVTWIAAHRLRRLLRLPQEYLLW